MNVLVTGATGRLGRHLCPALMDAGHDVRGADLRRVGNFPAPIEVANLLDREACYQLIDGMDAVVHLGNYPDDMLRDRQRLFIENVSMNMNIVQAAIELRLRKLVFSSSVQVISGHGPEPPSADPDRPPCNLSYLPADSDSPPQPANAYALSKHVGESQLAYAARVTTMQCIAVRFPWLVSKDARKWLRRGKATADLNPRQVNEAFSYLSMEDAAALIHCILRADLPGYRHYLAAARANTAGMDLPSLLARAYPDVPLRLPADRMAGLVDVSRLTAETGWEPSE